MGMRSWARANRLLSFSDTVNHDISGNPKDSNGAVTIILYLLRVGSFPRSEAEAGIQRLETLDPRVRGDDGALVGGLPLVKSVPRFFSELSCAHHPPQQGRGAKLFASELLVQVLRNGEAHIQAHEIRQL